MKSPSLNYFPLEVHSSYSLGEGTIPLERLIALAKAAGLSQLSLSDTKAFYGLMFFVQKTQKAGLQPVVATRVEEGDFSVLLVARSMRGYSRLCYLLSQMHSEKNFSAREHLLSEASTDYVCVSRDEELLEKHPLAFVEINTCGKDSFVLYHESLKRGQQPVLIHPVYFEEADYELHRVLRSVHLCKTRSLLKDSDCRHPRAHWLDPAVVAERYAHFPKALENSLKIAEYARFDFQWGKTIFPGLGPGAYTRLKQLCLENIPRRYAQAGKKRLTQVKDRLMKELSIIRLKGFSDYFLVVKDIVEQSGRYTCGRGSGAASIVCYLLFITHVDPIEHQLYFERFLNEARMDPPDIDVDFAWDELDHIRARVFERYPGKVAMVSNHNHYSLKSSLHECARVYGVPEKDIMRITRFVREYYDRENDSWKSEAEAKTDANWEQVVQTASKVANLPRLLSLHCGGMVVTPKPIHYYVPIQINEQGKGWPQLQFEKDQTEDFGLVKIDVLGNRSLAVIRDCLKAIAENTGRHFDYAGLKALEDEAVRSCLESGGSIGVFYVESPATRQLLAKAGKCDFEHLTIYSSAVRPAANRHNQELIRRIQGEPWTYLLPELEEIFNHTYGIMIYQEQISQVAIAIADFSLAESGELRKIISNSKKKERLLQLKEKFYTRGLKNTYSQSVLDELWDMIESFAGYSFCKPHSASYALLSYKCCWAKVHYPAEFMAAVLSNQGGFYHPLAYISETRRLGIEVLLPDINYSRWAYRGNGAKMHIGFMSILGLKRKATEALVEEREKNGAFTGLLDCLKRCRLHFTDVEKLILASCFRHVEEYSPGQLLFIARRYFSMGGPQEDSLIPAASLEDSQFLDKLPDIPFPSREKQMLNEGSVFGFTCSEHPMSVLRQRLPEAVIPGCDIKAHLGKRITVAGLLVTSKTVPTKKNDLMKFISLEDESAIWECVLFNTAYEKCGKFLEHLKVYVAQGKVDEEFGVPIFNVERIWPY